MFYGECRPTNELQLKIDLDLSLNLQLISSSDYSLYFKSPYMFHYCVPILLLIHITRKHLPVQSQE